MIETAPLEQAADAYARMMEGKARFRVVLVTQYGAAESAQARGMTLRNHQRKKEASMSSKPMRSRSMDTEAAQAGLEEVPAGTRRVKRKSDFRAYEIYLKRGELEGRELDDLASGRT